MTLPGNETSKSERKHDTDPDQPQNQLPALASLNRSPRWPPVPEQVSGDAVNRSRGTDLSKPWPAQHVAADTAHYRREQIKAEKGSRPELGLDPGTQHVQRITIKTDMPEVEMDERRCQQRPPCSICPNREIDLDEREDQVGAARGQLQYVDGDVDGKQGFRNRTEGCHSGSAANSGGSDRLVTVKATLAHGRIHGTIRTDRVAAVGASQPGFPVGVAITM